MNTVPATPATRSLNALPGVSVRYYDLVGEDNDALKASLQSQRSKNRAGRPHVVSTQWTIGAKVQKRTENGVCTVTGVEPTFEATADIPRLAAADQLPAAVKTNWAAFVADAEASAAADLWLVRDNLGLVRSALMASTCDGTAAAMDSVTQRLKALEAQQQQRRNAAYAAEAAAAAAATAAANKSKKRPANR